MAKVYPTQICKTTMASAGKERRGPGCFTGRRMGEGDGQREVMLARVPVDPIHADPE